MKRYLSALGLSVLAVCAFGAVAASSASAVTDHFTCPTAPCVVTGEQIGAVHVFGSKGSTLTTECQKATFSGTVAAVGVTALTVHPTYFECKTLGGNSPVDTKGCNFILTGETDLHASNTEGKPEEEHATVDLECEPGSTTKITGPGCTLTFGAQNNLLGVRYTNEGAGSAKDIKVDVTVDKIAYEGSGILCPAAVKGPHTDGFLTETVTAKGFEDLCSGTCPEPLTKAEEEEHGTDAYKDTYKEGAQVAIESS